MAGPVVPSGPAGVTSDIPIGSMGLLPGFLRGIFPLTPSTLLAGQDNGAPKSAQPHPPIFQKRPAKVKGNIDGEPRPPPCSGRPSLFPGSTSQMIYHNNKLLAT